MLLARFLLPFVIFRYPLPVVISCLVVDAADQTIFQWFGYDPPFYQSYDKAMDVFYLAIAYVSVMRNRASAAAARVAVERGVGVCWCAEDSAVCASPLVRRLTVSVVSAA